MENAVNRFSCSGFDFHKLERQEGSKKLSKLITKYIQIGATSEITSALLVFSLFAGGVAYRTFSSLTAAQEDLERLLYIKNFFF